SCWWARRPWRRTSAPSGSPAGRRERWRSSGVAADLPVRDGDAQGSDGEEPEHADRREARVARMRAPEPRERERAEDPAHEAADVPAPRDAAEREAEDQVDDDQPERLPAHDLSRSEVLEHEQSTEEPEDRARRAHRVGERRLEERPRRTGQQGHEVEEQVAGAAEHLLE